jgi:hypothetical protein
MERRVIFFMIMDSSKHMTLCHVPPLLYSTRDARQQIGACGCGSSDTDFRQQPDAYVAGAV